MRIRNNRRVWEEKLLWGAKAFLWSSQLSAVVDVLLSDTSILASISLNSLMKDEQLGQPREINFMTSFSSVYV